MERRRPLPTEGKLMRKPLLLACLLVALTGAWPARAATRLTASAMYQGRWSG